MTAEQRPGDDEASTPEAENRRLREELVSLRGFIDAMQNVMEACEKPAEDAEIIDLLADVLENVLNAVSAKDGSLLVLDEDTEELVFVIVRGDVPEKQLAWRRLPAGEGIAGWVVSHRRATIVNNAPQDNRFYSELDRELGFETHSILAVPLIGGSRVLGVIEVLNKHDGRLFSTHDQTLLTLMCRFAGELLYTLIRRQRGEITGTRPVAAAGDEVEKQP